MTIRAYIVFFSRSALGLGSLLAALVAGIALGMAGTGDGWNLAWALGTSIVSALLFYGLWFATGLGPRAAASEEARQLALRARAKLKAAENARSRLAAIRLPRAEISSARDLVVLEAGLFLDACREGGGADAYDPEAVDAIEAALDIVGVWQTEVDETSIEHRFGTADAHSMADAEIRVVTALKDKASRIARGRDLVAGEPSAPDRLSIEEELR